MAIMPGLYTISGLEAEIGVTRRKLGQLLATVPPDGVSERDQPAWKIKTVLQVIAEEEGKGLNPAAEKARLDKTRADIAEIELQKKRADVASLTVVSQVWSDFCTNVKTRMRSIPTKAAPLLAAETKAEDCKDILEKFIDEALSELADNPTYGIQESPGEPDASGDELEAAAAPDGEPMG